MATFETQNAAPDTQSGDPAGSRSDPSSARSPAGTLAAAYPGIEFSRRSRNWWAWLKGTPPECIHLDRGAPWMATLIPDTRYLRGKRSHTSEPPRPEVSLCRDCLVDTIEIELASYSGNVVAFEPDPETFSQYFFVAAPDFDAAGLKPELAQAIAQRLAQNDHSCASCAQPAKWLWFSREQVTSLDEADVIDAAPGKWLCARHGAEELCRALQRISEANIFYMNLPYGEAGAYVWI